MADTVKITKLDKGFAVQASGSDTARYCPTVAQVATFIIELWPYQPSLDDMAPERVVLLADEPGEPAV